MVFHPSPAKDVVGGYLEGQDGLKNIVTPIHVNADGRRDLPPGAKHHRRAVDQAITCQIARLRIVALFVAAVAIERSHFNFRNESLDA